VSAGEARARLFLAARLEETDRAEHDDERRARDHELDQREAGARSGGSGKRVSFHR
jgi:hypothetical protein